MPLVALSRYLWRCYAFGDFLHLWRGFITPLVVYYAIGGITIPLVAILCCWRQYYAIGGIILPIWHFYANGGSIWWHNYAIGGIITVSVIYYTFGGFTTPLGDWRLYHTICGFVTPSVALLKSISRRSSNRKRALRS